ncbi:MAG: zinc-ribbon domain-containing protein [Terriglobales bacterium]
MPLCPHCAAELAPEAAFCSACGRRLSTTAPVAPQAGHWYRGHRFVTGFLVLIATVGVAFVLGMIYFVHNTTIVTAGKNGSRIESPMGVVTTSRDPAKVAKQLGIELFPGAVGDNSAQALLNANNMVSLAFHTSATPRQVIAFYHVRYPDATVKRLPKGGYGLVQLNPLDTMTIDATASHGKTRITISDLSNPR